jgi:hypothetical protein
MATTKRIDPAVLDELAAGDDDGPSWTSSSRQGSDL